MAVDIFNNDTINIFTDGSIYHNKHTGETIGSAGAILVSTVDDNRHEIVSTVIDRSATNNTTEVKAISLGIDMAINYIYTNGVTPRVNLFSDSKTCILGLKEWIFKWARCYRNGYMYNSSGKPVANQEEFIVIIDKIVTFNLQIYLFHQKGHVNFNKEKSLLNARDVFNVSNNTNIHDMDFIKEISIYNDKIDLITKDDLNNLKQQGEFDEIKSRLKTPVRLNISNSLNRYKNNINKRRR